jgi:hypothetical protein
MYLYVHSCSVDPVIMGDLKYETNGNARAWVESHVFKYADKPNVQFACVLQLCNRAEPECTAITVGRHLNGKVFLLNYDNYEFMRSRRTVRTHRLVPVQAFQSMSRRW